LSIKCYVNNNPDGQLALLTTLMPPPEDNPNDEVNGNFKSIIYNKNTNLSKLILIKFIIFMYYMNTYKNNKWK